MKVLVTGANGFIGKNLATQLAVSDDFSVLLYERGSTEGELNQAIEEADFICHLAGVNRPNDVAEFTRDNSDLTRVLCQRVRDSGRIIPVIFASSVQVERANPYGASKLAAERVLLQLFEETGNPVYIFRLPNVFGKWCKPNYNSVVATFCHNISHDLPIHIDDPAYQLTLVYIDDLVDTFVRVMSGAEICPLYGEVFPSYQITVGELAERINSFRDSRNSLTCGKVGIGLVRALYATYVSYLPPDRFSYEVPQYGDARGTFVEMLKTEESGQFSFFIVKSGATRGEHYHHSKTEKFLVVKGYAKFSFRHILTDQFHEIYTSGESPEIVETVPGWTHNITNVGDDEMIAMLWANETFDRARPDTYACPV